jgi:hypothetical protein
MSRLRPHTWFVVVGAIALVAAHSVVLYHAASHIAAPLAVVLGVVALVVLKHLGVLGPLVAVLRRKTGGARRGP